MDILQEYTYEIEAALEQWTDQRVITALELQDLLLFLLYVPKVLSQSGVRMDGFTCRQKNGQRLLTVKAKEDGTPLVAFVTAASTTSCMSRFLNLLEDDKLTWVKDRYPWI